MPFYVPLGLRGILLWIGTHIAGCAGACVYWRASRRRGLMPAPILVPEYYPEAPSA